MKLIASLLLLGLSSSAFAESSTCTLVEAIQINDKTLVSEIIQDGGIELNKFCLQSSPLMTAINNENLEITKLLIDSGADVNLPEPISLNTPLMMAIHSKVEVLDLLLESGANVNSKNAEGNNAFNMAMKSRSVTLANLFIDHGAEIDGILNDSGKTTLMEAAYHGDFDMLKALLQAGADPSRKTKQNKMAFNFALQSKNQEIVQLLIPYLKEDEIVESALSAMAEKRVDIVKQLVEAYPHMKQTIEDNNLLGLAISLEEYEFAKDLITMGIDSNSISSSPSPMFVAADRNQMDLVEMILDAQNNSKANIEPEVLVKVAESGNLDLVKKLIAKGATLPEGSLSLDLAVAFGNLEVLKYFVSSGLQVDVDLESRDIEGDTPLLSAYKSGETELVIYLISAGADINALDKAGYSLLRLAFRNKDNKLFSKLISLGADINSQDQEGFTILMEAASEGDELKVMELLNLGANKETLNRDNKNASLLASEAGFQILASTISAFAGDTTDGF